VAWAGAAWTGALWKVAGAACAGAVAGDGAASGVADAGEEEVEDAGESTLDAAAAFGGVSAPAGTSSTSQDWHQRHLIASSWISSAQYGHFFIGRSFG
jgi:hypothetical protein